MASKSAGLLFKLQALAPILAHTGRALVPDATRRLEGLGVSHLPFFFSHASFDAKS